MENTWIFSIYRQYNVSTWNHNSSGRLIWGSQETQFRQGSDTVQDSDQMRPSSQSRSRCQLSIGAGSVHKMASRHSAGRSNNNRGLIVASLSPSLNQISNIHGHLFNRGTVVLFNVLENSSIVSSHKVNGYTLSTESSTTTNPGNNKLDQFPCSYNNIS